MDVAIPASASAPTAGLGILAIRYPATHAAPSTGSARTAHASALRAGTDVIALF
ncbi:unnamed protein product, partial [Nesidiocoris tenuis]